MHSVSVPKVPEPLATFVPQTGLGNPSWSRVILGPKQSERGTIGACSFAILHCLREKIRTLVLCPATRMSPKTLRDIEDILGAVAVSVCKDNHAAADNYSFLPTSAPCTRTASVVHLYPWDALTLRTMHAKCKLEQLKEGHAPSSFDTVSVFWLDLEPATDSTTSAYDDSDAESSNPRCLHVPQLGFQDPDPTVVHMLKEGVRHGQAVLLSASSVADISPRMQTLVHHAFLLAGLSAEELESARQTWAPYCSADTFRILWDDLILKYGENACLVCDPWRYIPGQEASGLLAWCIPRL